MLRISVEFAKNGHKIIFGYHVTYEEYEKLIAMTDTNKSVVIARVEEIPVFTAESVMRDVTKWQYR